MMENKEYYTQKQPSDGADIIGLVVEVVFGLFGFLGLGWLYAGHIAMAVTVFIGFSLFMLVEVGLAVITLGFSLCLTTPVHLILLVVSGVKVRDHIRNHPGTASFAYLIAGIIGVFVLLCCLSVALFGLVTMGVVALGL
jgi:hypothetical protein